jgi:hypothetical protein
LRALRRHAPNRDATIAMMIVLAHHERVLVAQIETRRAMP